MIRSARLMYAEEPKEAINCVRPFYYSGEDTREEEHELYSKGHFVSFDVIVCLRPALKLVWS